VKRPVAHGAVVLAISLAVVGAVGTADRGAASASADTASPLGSEVAAPVAAATNVPIGDARVGETDQAPDPDVTGPKPVKIQVGEIGLEADVVPVGVDDNNQFDVPVATTVGWYRYGPRPGEPGASVLAAHVDYGGKPGAFFHLAQLKADDRLQVTMDDGRTLSFRVTGVFQYDKSQLPADEIFREDGAPVLHLVTCGGTFNPQRHSYEANVVVTADPIAAPIPA
jgi:hypothetical protein